MSRGLVDRALLRIRTVNLWLFLAFFLILATCLVTATFFRWFTELGSKFNALANFECETAVSAYGSGGATELENVMQRHETASGVRAYLFNLAGDNLSGGPDRAALLSALPAHLRAFSRFKGRLHGEVDVRVVSQSSGCQCIVTSDLESHALYGNKAIRLLAFLAILCYGIATIVVLRMHRLESAIRSFGAGKLEIRVASSSRDPIRSLSKAFNQMASRVESLVDSHKRLCIDISHELRSPLTRLRLAVRLALSGTVGALEQIELESVRLNDLVEQLLDVARAEVDPTALRLECVDIESLVTEVADDCAIEANERGCAINLRFQESGTLIGDTELLRRVVENPMRNAIFHSPNGSSIDVTCKGSSEDVVISIRDRGPGVPDSTLQDIFSPFFRLESDRDRNTGGSGLGLSIVERAVALHRGSVNAENSIPGLRIEIRLPRS